MELGSTRLVNQHNNPIRKLVHDGGEPTNENSLHDEKLFHKIAINFDLYLSQY